LILVDTSVWIGLIRGSILVDADQMEEFAVCGPIVQEILQGLDDSPGAAQFGKDLANIPVLGDPISLDTFKHAAEIYRTGRRFGVTVRSSTDCLIAAIAIRAGVAVWHRDRDYDHIARYTPLQAMRNVKGAR